MISGWLCWRRARALSLLAVIWLGATIPSSQAQSEICLRAIPACRGNLFD